MVVFSRPQNNPPHLPTRKISAALQKKGKAMRYHTRLIVHYRQNVGDRSEQQDACGASPPGLMHTKGLLAVVADGMGGMVNGALYSRIAVEAMQRQFQAAPLMEDAASQLLDAYRVAQEEVLTQQKAENEGGSTVVAVLIRKEQCSFLASGDSRIYLLRQGKLLQLNREQTLGVLLDERAALHVISQEEAENNIRRKALYNHLGLTPPKAPDRNLTPLRLLSGDRLALMTDGVFGTLEPPELHRWLCAPLGKAADLTIGAVMEKHKPRQDNCTVLTIDCAVSKLEKRKDAYVAK